MLHSKQISFNLFKSNITNNSLTNHMNNHFILGKKNNSVLLKKCYLQTIHEQIIYIYIYI